MGKKKSSKKGEEASASDMPSLENHSSSTNGSGSTREKRTTKRKKFDDEIVEYPEIQKTPLKVKIKIGDVDTGITTDVPQPEKKKRKMKDVSSESRIKTLQQVIEKLHKTDKKKTFWYPVEESQVPGYRQVIKNPMDLATLESRLLQGKYLNIGDFKTDLNLIFENAKTFNGAASPISDLANKMIGVAEKALSSFSDSDEIITPLTSNSMPKECMNQILDVLKHEDPYSIFVEPVPETVPGYYEMIKKPMDFSTLRKKVDADKVSVKKFEKYIARIFANATKYNPLGTLYHAEALRIDAFSKPLLKQLKSKFESGTQATSSSSLAVAEQPTEEVVSSKKEKKKKKKSKDSTTPKKEKKSKETKSEEKKPVVLDLNQEDETMDDVKTPKKSDDKKKKTPKSSSTKWKDRVRITDLDFPILEEDALYALMNAIWKRLMEIDEYLIFKDPVSKDIPNYHNVITSPMDLTTVKNNIDSKHFTSWREFEDDVDLIYNNCKSFNSSDSIFSKEAVRQQRWFRKWKKDMVLHFGQQDLSNLTADFVVNYFNEISVVKSHAPKYDFSSAKQEESEPESTLPKSSLCYHLLKIAEELKAQDKNGFFYNMVDFSVHPKYKEMIKHPMSLSMVIDNCNNRHYKTIDQFINDIDLLNSNTANYFTANSKEAKESKRLLTIAKEKAQPLRIKTFKDIPSSSTATTPKSNKRETRAAASASSDTIDILSVFEMDDKSDTKKSDKKKKLKVKKRQTSSYGPTNPYNKDIELGWVPIVQPCGYWQFPSYIPDPNPDIRPKSIESNHDSTQSFIDPTSLSSSYSRGDDDSASSQDEKEYKSAKKDKKEKKEKNVAKTPISSTSEVPAFTSNLKTPKPSAKKNDKNGITHTPINPSFPGVPGLTPGNSILGTLFSSQPMPFPPNVKTPNFNSAMTNGIPSSLSTPFPQFPHMLPSQIVENRPPPKYSYLIKKYRQTLDLRKSQSDLKKIQSMPLSECFKMFSDDDRTLEEVVHVLKNNKPDIIPTENLLNGLAGFKEVREEDNNLIQRLINIATKTSNTSNLLASPVRSHRKSPPKDKNFVVDDDVEDMDDEVDEDEEELSDMEEMFDEEQERDGKKERFTEEDLDEEEDEEMTDNDILESVLQDFETVTCPISRRTTPEELFKKVRQSLLEEGVNIFPDEDE